VDLAFAAQAYPVQGNGSRRLNHSRIEMPAVGWEEPRPAQHLSGFDGLNGDRPSLSSKRLQRHFTLANDIKVRGCFAFAENIRSGIKAHIRRAAGYQLHVAWFKPCKKGMLCQDGFQCLHRYCSFVALVGALSLSRIALTSSVISMPTGHQ